MLKNIFFKEYLKLNKVLFALLILHAALGVYHWLRLRSSFTVGSPVSIWTNIINMNGIYFSIFEKPLYVTALALAVFQFYSEADKRRFRISCHLPANEYLITAAMFAFAVSALTAFGLLDLVFAMAVSVRYFPYEIYSQIPLILFYWYVNAVLFYAVASVLTLEPSWKHKIRLFIMLGAFYKLISLSVYNSPKIYIICLLILAALFLSLIFYPAERFRQGRA
jgi:hypothetical protein